MTVKYIGLNWNEDIDYFQLTFCKDTLEEAIERKKYWRLKGVNGISIYRCETIDPAILEAAGDEQA